MPKAINVASAAAGVQAVSGGVALVGISARESAGAPAAATIVLRNGTNNASPAVAFINLAASSAQTIAIPAIECPNGIYVDRPAGTSELAIHVL